MFGFAFWKVAGQRSGQQWTAVWTASCILEGFEALLDALSGRSWGRLGGFWAVLEALGDSLGTLGALLEASWALLGVSWALLGRSWRRLGRIVGALESILRANWEAKRYKVEPKK